MEALSQRRDVYEQRHQLRRMSTPCRGCSRTFPPRALDVEQPLVPGKARAVMRIGKRKQ